MQSPYPGMDPYLEDDVLWQEFHRRLMGILRERLVSGLVDRYRTFVRQRRYPTGTSAGGKAHEEDYVDICKRSDGRLVTQLDVLSPANKTTPAGREVYLEQRRKARDGGANLVEIDLLLQGQSPLAYDRAGLPLWEYSVTVTRATHSGRYEIYTSTLEKRLPRFRLPLAADDRDTVLDLQDAFTRCYEEGRYFDRIDYGQEPCRKQIALVAHSIWERNGCRHGRDREDWYAALARLRPEKRSGTREE
jgi:hypothetical protein